MYKHRFDPVSALFGLVFVALAMLFIAPADPWDVYFGLDLGWLLPVAILAVGVTLLAPVFRAATVEPPPDPGPLDEAHEEALAELGEEVAEPEL